MLIFTRVLKIAKLHHVCPSLSVRCIEQLGSQWRDFREIWCLGIFRSAVEKIQVSLKSDKNKDTLHDDSIYNFDHISLNSSQNEKYFRQT